MEQRPVRRGPRPTGQTSPAALPRASRSLSRLSRRRLRMVQIAAVTFVLWLALSAVFGGPLVGFVMVLAIALVITIAVAVCHERGLGLAPWLLVAARARPWRGREDMIRASLRDMTRVGLYRGPSGNVSAAPSVIVAWPTSALNELTNLGGVRPVEQALTEGWASIVWEFGATVLDGTDLAVALAHDPALPDGRPAARLVDVDAQRTASIVVAAHPALGREHDGRAAGTSRPTHPSEPLPAPVAPPPGYARTRVYGPATPSVVPVTPSVVPGAATLRQDTIVESNPHAVTVHVGGKPEAQPQPHGEAHDPIPVLDVPRPVSGAEDAASAASRPANPATAADVATAMPDTVIAARLTLAGCAGASVSTLLAPAFAGRSAGVELPLEFVRGTDTVSRVHARFDWLDDRWVVSPVKPRPGVMVNGMHIQVGAPLRDGDVISWGLSPQSPRSVVRVG